MRFLAVRVVVAQPTVAVRNRSPHATSEAETPNFLITFSLSIYYIPINARKEHRWQVSVKLPLLSG